MLTRRTVLAATIGAAAMPRAALAQAPYPDRPIVVIVPFAAGGPTDVVARLLGDHMSRTLGQQMIIENVGGAGGTIGMARVAQAKPDGYVIGCGNLGTQAAAPSLYQGIKYDPVKSFVQIGIANFTPMSIIAKTATPATDMTSFLAYLKANHEKMSYGHAGVGSISHVAALAFNGQFGFKPGLVAYRGTNPALTDLMAGQIDYMIDQSLNNIEQIRSGTIKAFAITAAERLESLPDVPTTKEAGLDFIFSAWNGYVAPAGTPPEIAGKLTVALAKALDDDNIQKRYFDLGSTAPKGDDRGSAGMLRLVEAEIARIAPLIKAAGASAQ